MNNVSVATELCGEQPALMDPTIDCSLCTLGWPMASGYVFLEFYGPRCKTYWCTFDGTNYDCERALNPPAGTQSGPYENDTLCTLACGPNGDPYWCFNGSCVQSPTKPDPSASGPFATFANCRTNCDDTEATRNTSYWLNSIFSAAYGKLKCYNPGDNTEPNAGVWAADIYAGNYKARATVAPVNPTTISVSISISVMNQLSVWEGYMTFATTITESSTTSSGPPWRTRLYESGFISVTPTYPGGIGDPVELAKITVSLTGMREGCGARDDLEPVCGMWDGSGWFTCFRSHIESATQPGVMSQMGLRYDPAGMIYATCEYLYWDGATWQMTNNTNPTFITDFRVVGVPGEGTTDPQQIQLDETNTIMAKVIGNGPLYICHYDGTTWECVLATIEQATHPHIHKGVFPLHNVTIYLYSLKFPSAEILPPECSPTYQTPWWCVDNNCVQTMIEPVGATSGPYATEALCIPICEEAPSPEGDYWCLYGNCVQSPTQPDPAATGPYTSPGQCVTNCPGPAEMVWRCTDVGCGTLSRSGAIMGGYTYYLTEAACNEACPIEFYCVENVCQQYAVGSPPASFSSGPFITIGDCYIECDTGEGWYCVSGVCGFYSSRPFGAIGPRYDSYFLCQPDCALSVEGTFQAYASPVAVNYTIENKTKPKEKKQDGQIDIKRLKDRFRLPCIHRGQVVPNSGFT